MKKIASLLLIGILFLTAIPLHTKASFDVYGKDPAPGTAPKYIEDAIAEGMKLFQKSDYIWGGGRDEGTYGTEMDCSSFIHYIFNKGSGLLLVNDNPKHAGDGIGGKSAVTTVSLVAHMDVTTGVKKEDLVRGDMIFFPGHVGLYLGDGIFLNQAGNKTKKTPGASLGNLNDNYWGPKYDGRVIKVKEGGKGVTVRDGALVDTSGGTSGTDTGDKNTGSGEKTGPVEAKGLAKYIPREVKTNSTGVKDHQEVVGADSRNMFHGISVKAYDILMKTGVILSVLFIGYTSISMLFYLAIGARGVNNKVTAKFEKITGVTGVYSKNNTIELLKLWVVSFVIMFLFLTGVYVDLMVVIYELVDKIWIF